MKLVLSLLLLIGAYAAQDDPEAQQCISTQRIHEICGATQNDCGAVPVFSECSAQVSVEQVQLKCCPIDAKKEKATVQKPNCGRRFSRYLSIVCPEGCSTDVSDIVAQACTGKLAFAVFEKMCCPQE